MTDRTQWMKCLLHRTRGLWVELGYSWVGQKVHVECFCSVFDWLFLCNINASGRLISITPSFNFRKKDFKRNVFRWKGATFLTSGAYIYICPLMLSWDVTFSLFNLLQIVQNSCGGTVKKQSKTNTWIWLLHRTLFLCIIGIQEGYQNNFLDFLFDYWHLDPSTSASLSASESVGKYMQLIDVLEIIGSNMKMTL